MVLFYLVHTVRMLYYNYVHATSCCLLLVAVWLLPALLFPCRLLPVVARYLVILRLCCLHLLDAAYCEAHGSAASCLLCAVL